MKFRTEIEIAPFKVKIGYENRILALGSCFAEQIAAQLSRLKFSVTTNPSGILFNPLSIAATLHSYLQPTPVQRHELHHNDQGWFHYGFHSDFSQTDPEQALEVMNAARQAGANALRAADRVVITFGTAWVYEHNGEVVANCHRQPSTAFVRRRLSVSQIVETFAELFESALADKQIILTISPVRHIGDQLQGNAVSKATLRLAAEELATRYEAVNYFPAYEILLDDLRDYRFYADDLVHPSEQAVAYIWEKFAATALSEQAQQLLPDVERIVTAAAHRPRNDKSEAYQHFCRNQLTQIDALSGIDFGIEEEYFRRCSEIIL
ncbi:MAG: GSCFA domain-containing protein [Alistipes sp.]